MDFNFGLGLLWKKKSIVSLCGIFRVILCVIKFKRVINKDLKILNGLLLLDKK